MRFVAAALACGLAVTLATGCSSDHKKVAPPPGAPQQAQGGVDTRKPLVVGKIDIESAGPEFKLSKGMRSKLLHIAQTYVDTAVQDPLTTGKIGDKYRGLFAKAIRESATGQDKKALTDEALGKASKYIERAKPVKISALVDGSGALVLLATNVSLKVKATLASGLVTVSHDTEFTYAKSGDDWIVTAYRAKTVRKLPKKRTTTTTAANGGKQP